MLRRVGLVGLLLVVALAAVPGAPVQLSYVYSDSMEPTIGVDDGYVLVPAGDVEEGDVVTFWSAEREAYVTHRVVGRTEGGFVTRGDNNPTTDQATGSPPVRREQIRGQVWTVGGEPVLIPSLGAAVALLRENARLVTALAVVALAYSLAGGSGDRPRREVTHVRELAAVLFVVAAISSVGALAYGGTTHDVTMVAVSSASAASSPSTIAVGSTESVSFTVNRSANRLTTTVVTSDGLEGANTTYTAANVTVAGTVPPPESTGTVPISVTVTQYPAVLPTSVLERLATVHPLAAATTTVSLIFAPLWALYVVFFDGASPLRPSRSRLWRILTGESG